jgi:hypothetical protein
VIVTTVPVTPDAGVKPVIVGVGLTVKAFPALAPPEVVTTILPVVAPFGTRTVIWVVPQIVGAAVAPLNFTELVPWLKPKPVPVIVTDAPTAPDAGEILVMLGAVTVKVLLLLAVVPTVTMTLPVVAPVGTFTLMEVELHNVTFVATVPLNLSALVPWVEPKLLPVIVTSVPTPPLVGDRLLIVGAAKAVTESSKPARQVLKPVLVGTRMKSPALSSVFTLIY